MITILKTALIYYFLALVCFFMMGFIFLFIKNLIKSKKDRLYKENKTSLKDFFFKKRTFKKKVVELD